MDDENATKRGITPGLIRAACRARLYDGLDHLSEIANDPDAKAADRIRALDTLGRFGLGAADQAAVHIHAEEGAMVLGIVHLPALDPVVVKATEEEDSEELPSPRLLVSGGEEEVGS